jgi:hypothetical protein
VIGSRVPSKAQEAAGEKRIGGMASMTPTDADFRTLY